MTTSSLFLVMIKVWHLPWLVTQITMDTCDTPKMGMVCHMSGILATIPVPIKPVGCLPWVYPYPCYTLLKILLSFAAQKNATIHQCNIKNAYLNSCLQDGVELYLELPPKYEKFHQLPLELKDMQNIVCK